jgi:hypothetical protein
MRKPVELALAAGRKRQSAQTGWVHHFYASPYELRADTIPSVDNACFILALFSSRTSENILEGKALLEKLLAFEVAGNFPIYLHEYPACKNPYLPWQIRPPLYWIHHYFHNLLGEELKGKLKECLERLKPAPKESILWADFLIQGQLDKQFDPSPAAAHWHPTLHAFIGTQPQEKTQPQVTLYDLFMGDLFSSYSKRALQDHPCHLRAALIQPFSETPIPAPFPKNYAIHNKAEEPFAFNLFWGDASHLHSFVCPRKKASISVSESLTFTFTLPDELPEEGEKRIEIPFFCDSAPDIELFVNEQKSTTFQLGDEVTIRSKTLVLKLVFELVTGKGTFFGQLFRGNRPMQLCTDGENRYEAYDWVIGLRTVKRTGPCTLQATLRIEE